MHWTILLMLVLGLTVGCGDGKPPEKTVFDPQVEALKKVRGVEDKLKQGAEQERRQIEKEEQ